jgi:hypothetical protein
MPDELGPTLRLEKVAFRHTPEGVLIDADGTKYTLVLHGTPEEWARVANWLAAVAAGKVGYAEPY